MLVFLLGFHGKDLDVNYSARPLAREIQLQAPDVKLVATDAIKRDMDYGLAFYRNQPMIHYSTDGVPQQSTCSSFGQTTKRRTRSLACRTGLQASVSL